MQKTTSVAQRKRSEYATAIRTKQPPEVITEVRRDLAGANIAVAIEKALADAPPLTDEQVANLTALLRGEG